MNLQIEVPDVDHLHAQALRAGATIYIPLEERWSTGRRRSGQSRRRHDPDGYLLRFSRTLQTNLHCRPRPVQSERPLKGTGFGRSIAEGFNSHAPAHPRNGLVWNRKLGQVFLRLRTGGWSKSQLGGVSRQPGNARWSSRHIAIAATARSFCRFWPMIKTAELASYNPQLPGTLVPRLNDMMVKQQREQVVVRGRRPTGRWRIMNWQMRGITDTSAFTPIKADQECRRR